MFHDGQARHEMVELNKGGGATLAPMLSARPFRRIAGHLAVLPIVLELAAVPLWGIRSAQALRCGPAARKSGVRARLNRAWDVAIWSDVWAPVRNRCGYNSGRGRESVGHAWEQCGLAARIPQMSCRSPLLLHGEWVVATEFVWSTSASCDRFSHSLQQFRRRIVGI